ncbi:MAG: leucine-rich repeat domain-containing protein [Ruminococcaceae bacterium]|nr:leucine-rich repeat domain-containing protein [Oscillospiraceae bacterium]
MMYELNKYTEFRIDDTMIMEYFGDGGSVIIPEGVTDIFFEVFCANDSITALQIAGTVDDITPFLFEGCLALKRVVLCEGVTKIGLSSFKDCAALERVFLPKSISSIAKGAFDGCGAFVIHYAGNEQMWKEVKREAPLDNATVIFNSTYS